MYSRGRERERDRQRAARIFEHADPPARCIRLFLPINPSGLDGGHATVANDRSVYDAFRGEPHRSARACGVFGPLCTRDFHRTIIVRNEDHPDALGFGQDLCIRDFHRTITVEF